MDVVSMIIKDWIKEYVKCPPPNPRQRGKLALSDNVIFLIFLFSFYNILLSLYF